MGEAVWRIVDAHECSKCGYLDRGRDGIMSHLATHDQTENTFADEMERINREQDALLPPADPDCYCGLRCYVGRGCHVGDYS